MQGTSAGTVSDKRFPYGGPIKPEGKTMRKLSILATLAASPAMAHPGYGGVHIPHVTYLAAVAVVVAGLAIYNFVKR